MNRTGAPDAVSGLGLLSMRGSGMRLIGNGQKDGQEEDAAVEGGRGQGGESKGEAGWQRKKT